MATREEIVNQAKKWVGLNEYDGSHMEIINIYNSHRPLARGYSVKKNDSWCATFVSAVAIKCNATDIMPTECSCNRMIDLYKKLGRWEESDSYIPSIGDIMMYDWQDNNKGDNKGAPDHVGIVTNISGNTITIIEGNIKNAVGYRTMEVNGKFIRGYCLPDYASKATKVETIKHIESKNKINTIKEVQKWANQNYKSNIKIDGIYGAKTKKALIKILQTELNQAYNSKLTVDGIWGSKTKAACPMLMKGIKNDVVEVLQALLICNKINNVFIDGDYGSITFAAVKAYQKKNGLVADGIAGKDTFTKLCA